MSVFRMRVATTLTAALISLGWAASASADAVQTILDEARQVCESYESGKFDPHDAVTDVDLDGDGTMDRVVDESRFACSSAASMYCGSGGCTVHAVVGDAATAFQAEGWQMIEWDGRPILLIARDGGWCGGAGSQLCFEAVNWSHGALLTVGPAESQ